MVMLRSQTQASQPAQISIIIMVTLNDWCHINILDHFWSVGQQGQPFS